MTDDTVTIELPRSKAEKLHAMLKDVDQETEKALDKQPVFWIGYLKLEDKLGLKEE